MTRSAIVYLVRHGQTRLNAAGLLRGHIDTPLDEVGRREARALADMFAGLRLGAIVGSPLARAQATAATIADATDASVEIDADLIDRDYGRWAGSSAAAVAAEFSSLDAAPGVEARERFTQRVTAAVVRAANRAWISPVVVVAHDAVNRQVLAQLVPGMGPAEVIPQRTGCWNRLEQVPGRWSAPIVDAVPGDGWTP